MKKVVVLARLLRSFGSRGRRFRAEHGGSGYLNFVVVKFGIVSLGPALIDSRFLVAPRAVSDAGTCSIADFVDNSDNGMGWLFWIKLHQSSNEKEVRDVLMQTRQSSHMQRLRPESDDYVSR